MKQAWQMTIITQLFTGDSFCAWYFRVVLGLSLMTGGIVLLALRIAGWSMIFGIPMVVISAVFIIYTYDDVLNRHLDLHEHLEDYYDDAGEGGENKKK